MQEDSNKQQIKVLLVGYNNLLLRTEERCLDALGNFKITTVLTDESAIDELEQTKPDVIVVDFDNRFQNIYELLKKFQSYGHAIPIILFSSDNEKDLEWEPLELGVKAFVAKNGDTAVVYSKLKACIESVKATSGQGTEKQQS